MSRSDPIWEPPPKPKKRFMPYTLLKVYHSQRCTLCVDGVHRHISSRITRLVVCPDAVIEKVKTVVIPEDEVTPPAGGIDDAI